MGAEEVRDIVNDYDPVTYRLPYEVENKFFRICYKPGDGITSFVDKRTGTEMAGTAIPFFTPVYQRTPLHQEVPFSSYEERRALGRNIRGKHAETHIGKLMEITCMEHGPVFTQLRLHYSLAGTVKADVLLKLYEAIPRIDFTLELGKTISDEVESVFLSLDLNRLGNETVLRKGAREAFRPALTSCPAPAWNSICRMTARHAFPRRQRVDCSQRCSHVLYRRDAASPHPPVRRRSRKQCPPVVFLGYEQQLGNKLQDGSVRLLSV